MSVLKSYIYDGKLVGKYCIKGIYKSCVKARILHIPGLQVRRRKGRQRMCAEGATQILEACKNIVKGAVDLSSWEKKITEETGLEFDEEETEVGE